jgi:hypothetical protein
MTNGFPKDRKHLMQGADAEQLQKAEEVFDPAKELAKLGITPGSLPTPIELPEKDPLELTNQVLTECDDCDGHGDVVRSVNTGVTAAASLSVGHGSTITAAAPYAAEKAAYEASGSKQGMRFNTGKLRYDLLPPEGLEELVKVYTMGAEKYAPRNWEKGISVTGCFASIMRHSFAWLRGETRDPESGLHHMGHVAWNAIAIVTFYYRKMEDDRPVIQPEA